jgi:uncharacterized protein (TIGR00725 family)
VPGRPPQIAVCGESDPDTAFADDAYEVGRLLAERGARVLCGGTTGVMEAVARGARQGQGLTIGILAGEEAKDANPYVDIAIPTGIGFGRNAILARAADGVIAIGGGWGTLSEIALARRMGRPVVTLHSWRPDRPQMREAPLPTAATPGEAVAHLYRILGLT